MKNRILRLINTFHNNHWEEQEEYYAFVNYNDEFIKYDTQQTRQPTSASNRSPGQNC